MANINDLTKQQLNTLAGLGRGWELRYDKDEYGFYLGSISWFINGEAAMLQNSYDPCNNGGQAMELVEKYEINLNYSTLQKLWEAGIENTALTHGDGLPFFEYANTPKLASVRAYVASIYGTDIDYDAIVGGE